MDASTRLYKRLGEIPEDPNDPESLDDLIVCAFGAFERYYVCWKTKGGEFKSGAHAYLRIERNLSTNIENRWLRPPSRPKRLALPNRRHNPRLCLLTSSLRSR